MKDMKDKQQINMNIRLGPIVKSKVVETDDNTREEISKRTRK